MTSNNESDSDKSGRREGYIPSYLPQSIGKGAEDALKEALADSTDRAGESPSRSEQQKGSSSFVFRHALIVLAATAVWGIVATLIWPDVGTLVRAEMGFPDALAEIDAMTDDEVSRSLDVWFYFMIGSPIVVLIGFTVIAVLAKNSRLKHVLAVAFIIWLVNSAQVLIGTSTLQSHAFSLVKYAVLAIVAVGLSFVFKKPSPAVSQESPK